MVPATLTGSFDILTTEEDVELRPQRFLAFTVILPLLLFAAKLIELVLFPDKTVQLEG